MKLSKGRPGVLWVGLVVTGTLVGGLVGYNMHNDGPVSNFYSFAGNTPSSVETVPSASSSRALFDEMTERYESQTAANDAIRAAVRDLMEHPVPNPRTETVPEWTWVTVLAHSDDKRGSSDDTCGADVGGKLTEIGPIGDSVLVVYEPPAGKPTGGTPCDGGEIFLVRNR